MLPAHLNFYLSLLWDSVHRVIMSWCIRILTQEYRLYKRSRSKPWSKTLYVAENSSGTRRHSKSQECTDKTGRGVITHMKGPLGKNKIQTDYICWVDEKLETPRLNEDWEQVSVKSELRMTELVSQRNKSKTLRTKNKNE